MRVQMIRTDKNDEIVLLRDMARPAISSDDWRTHIVQAPLTLILPAIAMEPMVSKVANE